MIARIVTCTALLTSLRASAAECPATAVLEGEGALVDSIDSELVRRGVATSATPSCPAAKARIERRGTGVAVIVTDPDGRRSERTLSDLDAAASLIESWARQDINAAALFGWTEPPPLVVEPHVDVVSPAPVVAVPPRARDPFSLVAGVESSLAFDRTSWFGARAGACATVGPVCAGAHARLLSNDPRRSYDVLAGVELPIPLGRRAVLVTGAAIGAGWFQTQTSSGEMTNTVTTTGLRLDGHVALAIAIAPYVSLHAGVSLGGSPQAPVVIETGGDAPVYNGEPVGYIRGDVGLRIGAP